MNIARNPGVKARKIIADRWPELSKTLAESNRSTDLAMYSDGLYSSIVANNVRLASAWDPETEAREQLKSISPDANQATIFGVGMGYLPLVALDERKRLEKLFIVPMNVGLFSQLLDCIDMSQWLEDPRVSLCTPTKIEKVPIEFAVTTALLRLADESAEYVRDLILRRLSETYSRDHQEARKKIIAANLRKNLILANKDSDINTVFNTLEANQPVIVVAAGPTLDHCIDCVINLQKKGGIIISVDAALKTLIQNKIIPDYVVVIDPLDWVIDFISVESKQFTSTHLVYFPTASHQAVLQWPGLRLRAAGTHKRYQEFQRKCPTSVLFSSGSVVHPATDLAIRLGAKEVFFAGADFGYPLERTHASCVDVSLPVNEVSTGHSVRDYRGNVMPSSMNLISYYRDLESYIEEVGGKHARLFNLGFLSARIRNVVPLELEGRNVV